MEALLALLASIQQGGLIAYATFVTLAWYLADKERKDILKQHLTLQKEFIEALDPIEKLTGKCLTLLELLTRGRQ